MPDRQSKVTARRLLEIMIVQIQNSVGLPAKPEELQPIIAGLAKQVDLQRVELGVEKWNASIAKDGGQPFSQLENVMAGSAQKAISIVETNSSPHVARFIDLCEKDPAAVSNYLNAAASRQGQKTVAKSKGPTERSDSTGNTAATDATSSTNASSSADAAVGAVVDAALGALAGGASSGGSGGVFTAIGAAIGGAVGGPTGAVVGAAIGFAIDQRMQAADESDNIDPAKE